MGAGRIGAAGATHDRGEAARTAGEAARAGLRTGVRIADGPIALILTDTNAVALRYVYARTVLKAAGAGGGLHARPPCCE